MEKNLYLQRIQRNKHINNIEIIRCRLFEFVLYRTIIVQQLFYICHLKLTYMATVNFLYRSKKENACLVIRLLYRYNNTDYTLGTQTKYEVSKEYWSKQHNKRLKDIDLMDRQTEVKTELKNIEKHILKAFNQTDTSLINKDWLKAQIKEYYNPSTSDNLPNSLVKYMETYIDYKRNEVKESTIKKCRVIKHLLIRFEAEHNKTLLINDIDTHFKKRFEDYCTKNGYAPNTIARNIRFIKTVCRHAQSNGLETSYQLDNIKTKYHKTETIYLTDSELEAIKNTDLEKEYLDNVRDWLLISCYTGQRVSDFMRFQKDWIRYEKNKSGEFKPLIEFTQVKTEKTMTIPLSLKVMEILNKRNGDFPRTISDQKYNNYVKEVCKLAGINQVVEGSKKTETYPGSKIYRKESGSYQKWELVSSHIGRRSFATNNYGNIPTSFLIYITGHNSEAMFLNYIGKSNKDIAMELTNYF